MALCSYNCCSSFLYSSDLRSVIKTITAYSAVVCIVLYCFIIFCLKFILHRHQTSLDHFAPGEGGLPQEMWETPREMSTTLLTLPYCRSMLKKTLFIEEIRHGICNTITFSCIFSLSHSSRVKQSILITKSIIITIIIFNIIIIIVGRSDHYDYEDHHLSIMAAPSTRREISDSSQILRFIIVTFLIIIVTFSIIINTINHYFP